MEVLVNDCPRNEIFFKIHEVVASDKDPTTAKVLEENQDLKNGVDAVH